MDNMLFIFSTTILGSNNDRCGSERSYLPLRQY